MEYEDDISAKEKTEKQSAWLQGQNEHTGRKESFSGKTCQRKKEIIRIIYRSHYVAFFFYVHGQVIPLPGHARTRKVNED